MLRVKCVCVCVCVCVCACVRRLYFAARWCCCCCLLVALKPSLLHFVLLLKCVAGITVVRVVGVYYAVNVVLPGTAVCGSQKDMPTHKGEQGRTSGICVNQEWQAYYVVLCIICHTSLFPMRWYRPSQLHQAWLGPYLFFGAYQVAHSSLVTPLTHKGNRFLPLRDPSNGRFPWFPQKYVPQNGYP